MTKGIPRSDFVRRKIAKTLAGRGKSPETRAAMAASKLVDKSREPEKWQQIYDAKLNIIQTAENIRRIKGDS